MATENNYEEILEDICEKLNNMDSVKELDVLDIKNSVQEIESLITDTQAKLNFEEIKDKLETIALQVDSCNDALLKDLYNDLNALKDNTSSVSQHLENLQNVQNLALTSAEFEEFQKQQLDLALKTNENIFNELAAIKEGASAESIKNLDTQLQNLHKNLTGYIEQVFAKFDSVPTLENIGSVVSDLNSVQSKSIKQTNVLIKDLQAKFTALQEENKNKDFENQIAKISEIYDSLSIIRAWIDKVGYINQSIENVYARLGESIDFDELSEKVDIIYENISALNSWTMKIDNVGTSVTDIQSKLAPLSTFMADAKNITNTIQTMKERIDSSLTDEVDLEALSNKMDIVYENLSAINEWASKVDTINEKVSTINEAFEDEMVASKVDLIYENISLLNEWVQKIDGLETTNDDLNNKVDEITETLSKASEIINDVPNLKDRLEELSSELHTITSTTKNDAESYIYTLLDIESDFLKLHKFVDDKTQVTTNDINSLKEHFSELNDDISSISIRTNKLILAADEANKEFKTYLDSFKATIHALDVQRQQFNPELKFTFLSEKINEMSKLLHNSINASRNLNNAFLYLAEWIDASGTLLNTMQADISAIKENDKNTAVISEVLDEAKQEVKEEIQIIVAKLDNMQDALANNNSEDIAEIKSMLTGVMVQLNNTLTPVDVDSLNARIDNLVEANGNKLTELETLMQEKINQQSKQILSLEEKIEALDSKFDKLISTLAEDQKQFEIKDALQFIAEQMIKTNETIAQNSTVEVVKEVSDKLASFDANINKIVSYIEED